MATKATADDWKIMADTYKRLTEDTSIKPIGLMLEQLNARVPFSQASGILDSGCGPAPIMARAIAEYGSRILPSCALTCSDYAPAMIDQVRRSQTRFLQEDPESLWGRVRAEVLDAMDLSSIRDDAMSHVAAGWVFFTTKDPQKCLSECQRVLRPDGVVAVSSWEETEWLKIMKPLKQIDPGISPPSMRQGWETVLGLHGQLEQARFRRVEVYQVPTEVAFESYSTFVELLLTKMPHMVTLIRNFSDEQREQLRELMIDEMRRLSLAEPGALKGVALIAIGQK
ncbi:class I SAM-dependent methyltransferase [Aspergillus affinis]|uniref:class I SAM-dependent methyltransferase n=1 Tax=Aspergillus affinis TaxID=1070780 RepID=UPI0022FF380B|nr:uncharacterized protein KD926_000603 [Aspergillus affinis]KAI9037316.1 hypothetical protein KD926_000603 [Aspergillus affinis]